MSYRVNREKKAQRRCWNNTAVAPACCVFVDKRCT